MNDSRPVFYLTGAAVTVTVLLGLATGPAKPTSPTAADAKDAVKPTDGGPISGMNDPRRPFRDFWSPWDSHVKTDAPASSIQSAFEHLLSPWISLPKVTAQAVSVESFVADLEFKRKDMDLEFLIATVPDPIDSRLGNRFDSSLDHIQMAVEAIGWNLDHYWLPWHPSGEQPTDRTKLRPIYLNSDPKSGTNGAVFAALHETEPGIILFRRPQPVVAKGAAGDARQKVLMLFVVGENPTFGVQKIALKKAIDIITSYQANLPKNLDYIFRIVGPYFTGGERSLSFVISRWASDPSNLLTPRSTWKWVVRSGSAMRIDGDKFEKDCGEKAKVEFSSTTIQVDAVMRGMFAHFRKLNGGNDIGKIALLTESDTEFGNSFIGREPDTNVYEQWGIRNVTRMKFPFHASQVRVAYGEGNQSGDNVTPSLVRSSSKLNIPFDEAGTPRDIIPSLSPKMSSATDEFVLAKILETISVEDFRYVGIIATDTRDILFLAGLIKEFCPDVQIFTPTADLLFGHPSYAQQLRGMIVGSTYPLFSMAQRWDPPNVGDRRRHLFSHQSDQGCYNATLSLLAGADHNKSEFFREMYDYGRPFDEMDDFSGLPPALDVGTFDREGKLRIALPRVKRQERPALWISVVGERGLWPLAYDSHPEKKEEAPHGISPAEVNLQLPQAGAIPKAIDAEPVIREFIPLLPQYTWQWGTTYGGLVVLVWLLLARQVRLSSVAMVWDRDEEIMRPLCDTALRWQQESFVLASFAILFASFWYCGVNLSFIPLRESPWPLFDRQDAWKCLTPSDQWNWVFSLFAIHVAQLTILAAIVTLGLRIWGWISGFAKDGQPEEPDRPNRLRIWGWISGLARRLETPIFRAKKWRWIVWCGVLIITIASYSVINKSLIICAIDRHKIRIDYQPLLFFERAVNLGNGVTPVVPVLILALAGWLWIRCQLTRLGLAERCWIDLDIDETQTGSLKRIKGLASEIKKIARRPIPHLLKRMDFLAAFGLLGIALSRLFQRLIPGVDGYRFTVTMMGVISLLLVLVFFTFMRFWRLWSETRKLLHELSLLPIQRAFDRLPLAFARTFGRYLDRSPNELTTLRLPVHQLKLVIEELKTNDAKSDENKEGCTRQNELKGKIENIYQSVSDDFEKGVAAGQLIVASSVAGELRKAAVDCLKTLSADWPKVETSRAFGDPPGKDDPKDASPVAAVPAWVLRAEEFVAMELIAFVGHCTSQLKNLGVFLSTGPLLLVLAITTYPFEPQRYLLVCLGALILCVVTGVLWAYVQMDRDEVLSRVIGTKPNQVTFDRAFFQTVLSILVPLIGLSIAHFPTLSDSVNQWFGPIMRVLK